MSLSIWYELSDYTLPGRLRRGDVLTGLRLISSKLCDRREVGKNFVGVEFSPVCNETVTLSV